jgi:hypothetical protein
MAQLPSQLQAALDMLVLSVKKVWLRPWYAKTLEARMAHRQKECDQLLEAENHDAMMEDESNDDAGDVTKQHRTTPSRDPAVTVAVVAIALYSFDEGILLDPPKEGDVSAAETIEPQVIRPPSAHSELKIPIVLSTPQYTSSIFFLLYCVREARRLHDTLLWFKYVSAQNLTNMGCWYGTSMTVCNKCGVLGIADQRGFSQLSVPWHGGVLRLQSAQVLQDKQKVKPTNRQKAAWRVFVFRVRALRICIIDKFFDMRI